MGTKFDKFNKFMKRDFNVIEDYKNKLVSCGDCLRRTKTDKDYMDCVDCFGNKIDWNCLVTIEEEDQEIYNDIKCNGFIIKE